MVLKMPRMKWKTRVDVMVHASPTGVADDGDTVAALRSTLQ